MKKILALTKDLFFTGKLNAALQNLGEPGEWQGTIVRGAADFRARLAEGGFALALVDLTARQAEPEVLIGEARSAGLPVLAFGAHTDPQSLRAGRQAGAYRAVPNSLLVTRLPELIAQAFDSAKAIPRDEDEPE